LDVGASVLLKATVTPANATNKSYTWRSSNSFVATVDQDGIVTAHREGVANIIATTADGALQATCAVRVRPVFIESITLTPAMVQIGDTVNVDAKIEPLNATDTRLNWHSSDTNIATVDSNGTVYGKTAGLVEITAEAYDTSGAIGHTIVAVLREEITPEMEEIFFGGIGGTTTSTEDMDDATALFIKVFWIWYDYIMYILRTFFGMKPVYMPVAGAHFKTGNPGDAYDFPNYAISKAFHGGTDLAKAQDAPEGSTVVAAFGGTVSTILRKTDSYGYCVQIKSTVKGVTYLFIYAHMQTAEFAPNLKEGGTVEAGQKLGLVGSTGKVTGPHLHFETRKPPHQHGKSSSNTDCIDPKSFY
jgi:hypothetical protein